MAIWAIHGKHGELLLPSLLRSRGQTEPNTAIYGTSRTPTTTLRSPSSAWKMPINVTV